jgi:hypothetical protein
MAPDALMIAGARTSLTDQLKAVGFAEVTMLSKPAQPSDAAEPVSASGGCLKRSLASGWRELLRSAVKRASQLLRRVKKRLT